jgi:hypothetical protein
VLHASTWNTNYVYELESGKNSESLSIYFLYSEILVIFIVIRVNFRRYMPGRQVLCENVT